MPGLSGGISSGASSSIGTVMGGVTTAVPYYAAAKAGGAIARANAPEGSFVHDIGRSLDRPLNVEQFWAEEMGAPGWVQDTLDVLNPLGAVEETISNAVGTVICGELYRQGLMDEETYSADVEFCSTLDPDIVNGYHVWAIPVAAAMRESRVVTWFAKWPALAWANHMAGKKSAAGYVLLHVGAPICKAIGVLARLMRRQRQSEV